MKEDNNSLQGNVRDFVIKFFFIFIVTLILSVFVMWALSGFASSWSSFISSDKWVLTGESAAVWLTLAPLFAISLAGSYVAIRIAESANIAQQQGNALATQQTPEYIKAFESAFAYARLKGLLITLPMSTRSLNELPEDTVNDNPDAVLNNDTLDSLLNNFVDELYQTSLLSLLPSIAEKLANEDRKYHILMLFSSLNNRNNYFSTLQASLSLINVIDKLLDPKDLEKNDDLLSGLSKTEGFFLEHVAPYVTLNRNITYSDLDYYRNPIKKSFCKILNSQISQGDIDLKYTGKETCVVEYLEGSNDNSNSLVIVSPQDIVLYKVLEEVRTYAEDRKLEFKEISNSSFSSTDLEKKNLLFRITIVNDWENSLSTLFARLDDYCKGKDGKQIESEIVVVIDQLNFIKNNDDYDYDNCKQFTLIQYLKYWLFIREVKGFFTEINSDFNSFKNQLKSILGQQSWIINPLLDCNDRLAIEKIWSVVIESSDDIGISSLSYGDELPESDGLDVLRDFHKLCFDLTNSESLNEELIEDLVGIYNSEPALYKIFKELSKSPGFERPFYGFEPDISQDGDLPNRRKITGFPLKAKVIGLTYPNVDQSFTMNPLLHWLLISSAELTFDGPYNPYNPYKQKAACWVE